MVPEIGQKYGPYEILSRLGGGGMGHVFKAWDARLHREVAIKLLHNEYAMTGMRERFLREARAASALNHPNICTVFDIGEQSGDPYLVMELLEGETLKDRIQYHTIPSDDLICIAREVAEALGAAHAKGVIHRDIKPANIFLVPKPNGEIQAKVLDFGLAKFEGGTFGGRGSRSLDLTAAGATVGTLAYMSPEQARGESLDSRSDLFSLGVVMYEMATRQIPFRGATSALVFVQLLNHAPEPVREWNDAIPRELERIITKLLAKERTARFQTAQELEDALAKVTEKNPGWLRKVAGTVPLVRSADPVAREKRLSKRRLDSGVSGAPVPSSNAGHDSADTPFPSSASSTASPVPAQLLRPVARMPRLDASPAPASALGAIAASAELSPATPPQHLSSVPTATPSFQSSPAQKGSDTAVALAERPARVPSAPALTPTSAEFSSALPSFAADESESKPSGIRALLTSRGAILALAVTVLLVAAALLLTRGIHLGRPLFTDQDTVVLTEIENRTSDKSLDGTVAAALQFSLSQSPFLHLRTSEAYRLGRRQTVANVEPASPRIMSHKVAERLGAKAFLIGSISGSGPYQLQVDMVDTVSNEVVTSAEEQAAGIQELPGAIDHISDTLRSKAGETSESIGRSSNPLAREATVNFEALHAMCLGDDATTAGHLVEAIGLYRQAVQIDPKFVQALLRLTVLYRRERAELAAGTTAKLALDNSANASGRTRTLAQYEYEMNGTGDYAHAIALIRTLIAANPHDSEALDYLARSLRLTGRVAEALTTAQQAYTEDPYNVDAYTQAQNALIGLDRYEAASQMEVQVDRMGIGRLGGMLTSAYLEGRKDELERAIAAFHRQSDGFRPDSSYGLYLDNVGRLVEGAAMWVNRAKEAEEIPGLDSAAAYLLSQGAIDRALLGDCGNALPMAHQDRCPPAGHHGTFQHRPFLCAMWRRRPRSAGASGPRTGVPAKLRGERLLCPRHQGGARVARRRCRSRLRGAAPGAAVRPYLRQPRPAGACPCGAPSGADRHRRFPDSAVTPGRSVYRGQRRLPGCRNRCRARLCRDGRPGQQRRRVPTLSGAMEERRSEAAASHRGALALQIKGVGVPQVQTMADAPVTPRWECES